MIKLKHKNGLFGTSEVIGGDDIPYYLEFTKEPFALVAVHLNDEPNIDISSRWSIDTINENIYDGDWVIFDE